MNKNISIALIALFALGGITASAQTGGTTEATATVTTTNATGSGAVGLPPLPPKPTIRPAVINARAEMEAREKALRAGALPPTEARPGIMVPKQTQGATFGEKARIMASTTANTKDMRGEVKDKMKNEREEMEKRANALRASSTLIREKMKNEEQKKRLEKAREQTKLINRRIDVAIERVQKLSERVSERLNKLETAGVDVTVSRGHIVEAKAKLEEARTKAVGIKLAIEVAFTNAVTSTSTSTTPKDAMKNVQDLVRDVTKTIQEAHRHVALAISSTKPGLNTPRPATTTATTTQ